jgi:hypothetical protein
MSLEVSMDNPKSREREAYQKPLLGILELKSEEVLGTSCKTTGRTAPGGTSTPCSFANCNQNGS